MTRTTSEALLLITNALTSLSTQEVDTERRLSAEIATASKEDHVSAIFAPTQAPTPPSLDNRLDSMHAQILASQTKLVDEFNSKYTDLNGKINNPQSRILEPSPTSASINAVTRRSGKQLNPILQSERSA